ncbi:MAG: trypsin-like peptidase domain-containing protein [Candidatus Pacearchaeota archaeon]
MARIKTEAPHYKLKKSHKIGVSIFLIVKIMLIIAVIYLAQTLISLKYELKNEINQSHSQLQTKILENQQQTQGQINELRNSLLSTKSTLTQEISQLKADANNDFSGVISDVIKGVVSVGTDVSQGSGFIISENGYIITNAHVLYDAHYVKVLTYESTQWTNAELIGYNEVIDIAILKIPGQHDKLAFGDSSTLKVGEKAIALGNPLGLSFSVTEGIISALNREGPNNLPVYIQIDVPLNSGNSGGPLVSKNGEVIGINNFKVSGGENIGFALESDTAVETINNIFKSQNVSIRV